MRRKTHEEYIQEVAQINSNIEVVGQYVNTDTKILHKCKLDNYEWMAFPTNVLRNHGCPECANRKKAINMALTEGEYIQRLFDVNPNIKLIGKYKNANTKVMHCCKICGHQWKAYPNNLLSGKGCKKCADKLGGELRKKSHDTYVQQVNIINKDIDIIGSYIDARTPIKHKCKLCGHEWDAIPDNILRGHGCGMCLESNGEKQIRKYLILNFVNFTFQHTFADCKNKKVLPFDFYLPDYNVCIEYDGIQHFEPIEFFGGEQKFAEQQYNDNIKTQYCIDNNITLLRIKYNQDIEMELNKFFNDIKLTKEAV